MARGELTDVEKRRVNVTIAEVEALTGLEFCVIVRSKPEVDARQAAERVFRQLGLHQRPAVMIMVVPNARSLEVMTAPEIGNRLTNDHCRQAIDVMTGLFSTGDISGGIEQGLLALADFVGPRTDGGTGHPDGEDLPNIVDLDES